MVSSPWQESRTSVEAPFCWEWVLRFSARDEDVFAIFGAPITGGDTPSKSLESVAVLNFGLIASCRPNCLARWLRGRGRS